MSSPIRFDPRDFIMPPYLRCPNCGKTEYGVLGIHRDECSRRCRECFYRGTVTLPKLKKKVIYIDQFAFSNIMKLLDSDAKGHARAVAEPFWKELFETLSVVCHIQLVVCPDSREHQHESLTSPFYKALKRTYEHFSGGESFEDTETIQSQQVGTIASAWLKNEPPKFDFDPESVTSGRLHDWDDRIYITVDGVLPGLVEELREVRSRTHDGLKKVFETWQRENKSFKDVYVAEKAGYREALIRGQSEEATKQQRMALRILRGDMPSLDEILPSRIATELFGLRYLFGAHVGIERAQQKLDEFLNAKAMDDAPFNTIAAAMYASLAMKAAAGQREVPNQGTRTDINIVSTLLPFCDAMFMDNGCRALLQDIPQEFALPFPCRVFSPNTGDEFLRYLGEIRDSATNEHLVLVEQCYGPNPLEPQTGIAGVGKDCRVEK